MKRRTALSILLGSVVSSATIAGGKPTMKAYSVDFPHHVLEFSLPEEMARSMGEGRVTPFFDPTLDAFERGFRKIAGSMYDFKGPFWVGALGSLSFNVDVVERSAEYDKDITTAEGLEKYVYWWLPRVRNPALCTFGRVVLNGVPAVSRRFGDRIEIFSFPLDQRMFAEFGLSIEPLPGGTGRSWEDKATAMRDAIKATIVLKPKNTPSP